MVKAEQLKNQVLFQDLDKAGLTKMAKIIKHVSLKKGEQLFKEKDDTHGLYLINSGKVEISRVTADGWRQHLQHSSPLRPRQQGLHQAIRRTHRPVSCSLSLDSVYAGAGQPRQRVPPERAEASCRAGLRHRRHGISQVLRVA